MKTVIANWKMLLYRIKIEDIKGKQWEGYIYCCDDNGVGIKKSKPDEKSIVLLPWSAIYKIERC